MDSDMENIRITTANEGGLSPFEMWYGIPPTPAGIQSFVTVGYMRASWWGCANSHPRGSSRVRNLAAGEVVCHQDVSRHPAAAKQSEENKDKNSNGDRSNKGVGAGSGVGKFDTVKAHVILQQEQDVSQGGGNYQPESLEEDEEEEERENRSSGDITFSRSIRDLTVDLPAQKSSSTVGRARCGSTRTCGGRITLCIFLRGTC